MLVGLDVLKRGRNTPIRQRLKGGKLGLLTHAPAVDEDGLQTWQVLSRLALAPEVIFSPEHGFDPIAEAEVPVEHDDADVGDARLISLYGKDKESLAPSASDLQGLDVLLIDLVDVGARYYTYAWTALLAARAAQRAGVHTLVLDRPNPLSGDPSRLEGRPQDEHLCSFVGLVPIPIRHSMTIAELLVSVFNQEDLPMGPDGALSVVPTLGWERHRLADAWGRPFVPPSPNMPTLQSALVYPGACLLEGTNLSEGRGTTTPFNLVGAPFLKAEALAASIGSLPGAWVRPARFVPSFGKHQGEVCQGVMIQVSDEARFHPVAAYLKLLWHAHAQAPDDFQFLTRVYEFESQHCAFDLLTGTASARTLIQEGAELDDLLDTVCRVDEEWVVRVETAEEMVEEVTA